jgi:hypothetical protein
MKIIFLDPTYSAYENNQLFNASDKHLNRDGTLLPFIKLKEELEDAGYLVETYDLKKNYTQDELRGSGYISFGNMKNLGDIEKYGLRALAFFILEPPLVLTGPYRELAQLSHLFEKVFLHNLEGDCYSLEGVKKENLRKLYWPQPYGKVIEEFWARNERISGIVIINGHHRPKRMFNKELYSERIRWGVSLSQFERVDLFGRGWDKLFSIQSLWIPYLRNYFGIKKIYRGPCSSKLEVLSQYEFALCFENLRMRGYITEKIFDCFFSGVIPIYLGGEDIERWIPADCYIDLRHFKSGVDLASFLKSLGPIQKENYRLSAKKFIESGEGQKYFSLFQLIFDHKCSV